MKRIQRYSYLFLCTAILLLAAVWGSTQTDIVLPRFFIQGSAGVGSEEISIFDDDHGNYYVFLPSYADMEQVRLLENGAHHVSIGDGVLSGGMDCAGFALETPYAFALEGQKLGTLWFYKSENIPSMFIDTASGRMEYIHRDKSHKENSAVTLYTADGEIDYSGRQCELKGRGNSSWGYDKRPYSLTLSSDADLMDMGAAANWVLLANASDETNLNNKLAFELAARAGFSWTPQSQWVDLYLNGEYHGLYLLAEKVEIHESRLSIDEGGFLCKIDLEERWTTLRNPFLTESGRAVEVSQPENLSEGQMDGIKLLANRIEQEIFSGTDLCDSDVMDLDSWVRRYLIDEISGNIDSDIASCFFYVSDGVCYAGPVWDYDMAFGNCIRNQEAHAFIAKNIQSSAAVLSPYYRALYANASFRSRIGEIYRAEFVPVLRQMLNEEIDVLSAQIAKASQANSLRWRTMFDTVQSWYPYTVRTAADLRAYLSRRMEFLNQAWLEDTEFCTIQFRPAHGSSSWNISVKKGERLKTDYIDIASTVWLNGETGERFDFSQPVMTDMILLKKPEESACSYYSFGTGDYVTVLSIGVLLIMLAGFAAVDAARNRKERRG